MYLIAFDFDQTIINLNSDIVLRDKVELLPPEMDTIHKEHGWIGYMQKVFDLLYDQGIKLDDITSIIKSLESVEGMCELITRLSEVGHIIIIISDANSYCIDTWLSHHSLKDKIAKIFTNPAHIESGKLKIGPYHSQTSCKLSSRNLCKGQVLEDYIKEQRSEGVDFDKILYIGDGANDVCPILRLKTSDLAYVRENHRCHALVKGNKAVRAKVILWRDGRDITDSLE